MNWTNGVDLGSDKPLTLTVLGATGSVGQNTLDLVSQAPDRFRILALTANGNVQALAEQARRFSAKFAVVADPGRYQDLKSELSGSGIEVAAGPDAVIAAADLPADCVMASIMGAAGLPASLAAVRRAGRVALANKECLVTAGHLFMGEVAAAGCELVPVDSEHSAVFQSLAGQCRDSVEKVTLTASGGPFRTWSRERIATAGPDAALKHPNWTMGRKISIDSATMMNKGLELIEAHYLFGLDPDQLDVVVHPQSIIHCLVAFRDGSVIAQLGVPDMRTPIACALSWPTRLATNTGRLDLAALTDLTFEHPDPERFPATNIAMQALREGGTATAILNAANEIAVEAFLDRRLSFPGIVAVVKESLERGPREAIPSRVESLDDILAVDRAARALALKIVDEIE